jgi:disulfide bond formation protein DsbB
MDRLQAALRRPEGIWAAGLGIVAALALIGAYTLQYGFGFEPCHLCLWERWPYWLTVVAALVTLALGVPRTGIVLVVPLMVIGTGIAVFHVGVEQGIFALPESCVAGEQAQSIEQLRQMLAQAPARCDQVSVSFLGASLAFWNLVLSAALLLAAAWGFWRTRPRS